MSNVTKVCFLLVMLRQKIKENARCRAPQSAISQPLATTRTHAGFQNRTAKAPSINRIYPSFSFAFLISHGNLGAPPAVYP